MFRTFHSLRSTAVIAIAFSLLTMSVVNHGAAQSSIDPAVPTLIYRQQYNEAITRLEQILEREPANGEALTYMATAELYQRRDFTKALDAFKAAFDAGGGATFLVTHSHEKFTTDYVAEYCRGWLHLRKDGIKFVPIDGAHGFSLNYSEVEEFKINRLSKRAFHIKFAEKSQNFHGRSNTEFEPLLIIALYKSFTHN